MVILLLSGAAAGSDGGWIGSLIGMAAMGCTFGVLYFSGAYSRAKAFHSENTEVVATAAEDSDKN